MFKREFGIVPFVPFLGQYGFGELVTSGNFLKGNEYTATIQTNTIFQKFETTIETKLKNGWVGRYSDILNVKRVLGSGRFLITFKMKQDIRYSSMYQFITQDFADLGMDKFHILQIESGKESTKPGGLIQAIPETVGQISTIASKSVRAAVGPLLPWILLGLVGFAGVQALRHPEMFRRK